MRLDERNPAAPLPRPWNPKQIDPALLTYQEYYKIANERAKFHPGDAYETTLEKMRDKNYLRKEHYPQLLKRVKIKGISFEFRVKSEKSNYVHVDTEGVPVRGADNKLIPMTDAEISAAGLQPNSYNVVIYNEEGDPVGSAQDEWGCVLVYVANEYRGFGLGSILGRIARTFEPGKTSGGFTDHGLKNFRNLYRDMVRDAVTQGRYTALIRAGKMTVERAKAIIASARLEKRKPVSDDIDLSGKNPANWLLYADESAFILYDKNLAKVIERGGDDQWDWGERMIKGYLLVRFPHDDAGIVVRFGADTPVLKSFLLNLGASYCAQQGVPFLLDLDDVPFASKALTLGKSNRKTGYERRPAKIAQPINYAGMAQEEQRWRGSFDRYGEFMNWIHDLADRKFRPEDKQPKSRWND